MGRRTTPSSRSNRQGKGFLSALQDRHLFGLLLLISLGIDVGGFTLQTLYRLDPCPLCIFQRVLFLVLATLGFLGVIFPQRTARLSLAYLALLVSLGGLGVAAYQSWMQFFPEAFSKACNYAEPNLIEQFVDWLGMLAPTYFMASGLCTSKAWTLFNLSLANWAFITYSLLCVGMFWRLRQR